VLAAAAKLRTPHISVVKSKIKLSFENEVWRKRKREPKAKISRHCHDFSLHTFEV